MNLRNELGKGCLVIIIAYILLFMCLLLYNIYINYQICVCYIKSPVVMFPELLCILCANN